MRNLHILAMLLEMQMELQPEPRPDREFLLSRGWVPLGPEAGTGIEGWGKVIDGEVFTISIHEALKREGFLGAKR